jgi:acylphosphatase
VSEPGTPARGRLEATVHGVVQGVGFRVFVLSAGRRLGLDGWVANASDGSVRVLAEGDEPDLDDLLAALHEGPVGAWVSEVRVSRSPARGGEDPFHVRAGSHPGD